MGRTGKLAERSSFYFVSNIVVVLAGLISLPIWTRLFTTEQYGLFSLFNVTLAFMVALSKFGMQHAALRFYSDVRAGKMAVSLRQFYSSMFIGGFSMSLAVTAVIAVTAYFVLASPEQSALQALIVPVALCVVLQSTINILVAFIRAEQRAKFHSVINVLRRYGQLALALLMIVALGARVSSVYWGYVLFAVVMFSYLALELFRKGNLSLGAVSWKLVREGMIFGFPMIWLEVSNKILSVGDRYMLQYFIGPAAVSMYSVGYNVSQFIVGLLAKPLNMAAIPMYLTIWANAGEEATRVFLRKALKGYLGLAIPLTLGISWFGEEIVVLLATDKFLDSAEVIPWAAAGIAIRGAYPVFAAGLIIQKKTFTMMTTALAAAGVNLLLNLWLVPISGPVGAAQATLISYGGLALWITLQGRRHVRVSVSAAFLLKSGALALFSVWSVDRAFGDAAVLWKIALVILLYGGAMLLLESEARQAVRALVEMVRRRFGRGAE